MLRCGLGLAACDTIQSLFDFYVFFYLSDQVTAAGLFGGAAGGSSG